VLMTEAERPQRFDASTNELGPVVDKCTAEANARIAATSTTAATEPPPVDPAPTEAPPA